MSELSERIAKVSKAICEALDEPPDFIGDYLPEDRESGVVFLDTAPVPRWCHYRPEAIAAIEKSSLRKLIKKPK